MEAGRRARTQQTAARPINNTPTPTEVFSILLSHIMDWVHSKASASTRTRAARLERGLALWFPNFSLSFLLLPKSDSENERFLCLLLATEYTGIFALWWLLLKSGANEQVC